jgi:hypothetical protein
MPSAGNFASFYLPPITQFHSKPSAEYSKLAANAANRPRQHSTEKKTSVSTVVSRQDKQLSCLVSQNTDTASLGRQPELIMQIGKI